MKPSLKKLVIATGVALASITGSAQAAGSFSASGADAASILGTVDSFRAALGVNNGVGPCAGSCVAGSGRREVNWDAVPDSFSDGGANAFPGNFFNLATGNPAGRVRGIGFSSTGGLVVSADADSNNDGNPGPATPLFGDLNGDNPNQFAAFSAERIFGLTGTRQMDITFSVPGSPATPALVKGMGVVFTDVEIPGLTRMDFYGADGTTLLLSLPVPVFPLNGASDTFKSFSFAGHAFDAPVVSRVSLFVGDMDLLRSIGSNDIVAMDDFIYGEPAPVPEPSTWILAALGLAVIGARRRLARRRDAAPT